MQGNHLFTCCKATMRSNELHRDLRSLIGWVFHRVGIKQDVSKFPPISSCLAVLSISNAQTLGRVP